MNACDSPWRERLSEYLDGDLSAPERSRVEAHLEACPECARALDELEDVVRTAASLPDRPPERDLWPGVEAAIAAGAPASAREHGDAPEPGRGAPAGKGSGRSPTAGRRSGGWWGRRTVRMSVPQLAAAALLVMLLSGGATWLLGPTGSVEEGPPLPAPDVPARTVGLEAEPPEEIAPELAELERALARVRDRLDPATVRVLEKNLSVIDRAIQDSRRALELDPANPFLERHLDRAWERKLEYLREAASVAEWSS